MQLYSSRFTVAVGTRTNLSISCIRMVLATGSPDDMDASRVRPGGSGDCNFSGSSDFGGHMLAAWGGEANEVPGTFTLSVDEGDIPEDLRVIYDTTHKRFDDTKVRELFIVVYFKDSP